MSGTAEEYKGRAKEAVGDLTGDKDLQREGKADQASGKVKQAAEDVKDKVDDAVDAVKDKFKKDCTKKDEFDCREASDQSDASVSKRGAAGGVHRRPLRCRAQARTSSSPSG